MMPVWWTERQDFPYRLPTFPPLRLSPANSHKPSTHSLKSKVSIVCKFAQKLFESPFVIHQKVVAMGPGKIMAGPKVKHSNRNVNPLRPGHSRELFELQERI